MTTGLSELDSRYVWHPFTQISQSALPIPIVRAEGSVLYTQDGRAILDGISSWWVNLHGHAHPAIAEAVYRQALHLEHVLFAGFTHAPAVELASKLAAILPGSLERIFYSDNGSTAVEVGIKMALQYWHNQGIPRTRILAFEGAYHGDTFGAMAVSERGAFSAPFDPYLFPVEFIPAPLPGSEELALDALEKALSTGDVALLIYEPLVQGSGGMRMHSAEALGALLEKAKDHGVLLMADEVMTGFYRTGSFFASDAIQETTRQAGSKTEGITPDIISLSKGLTGGAMALGATACSQSIYEVFRSGKKEHTFFHGHSYTANPIACAAALASLTLSLSNETLQAVKRIEAQQAEFVKMLCGQERSKNGIAQNARSRGTILALEVATAGASSYFNPIRERIYPFFLDRNILLRPLGNTIYVLPPYCMTTEELASIHAAILELLEEAKNW